MSLELSTLRMASIVQIKILIRSPRSTRTHATPSEVDDKESTEGLHPRLYKRLKMFKVKNHVVSSEYFDDSDITRMLPMFIRTDKKC